MNGEKSQIKHILIVESKNDAAFIRALLRHLQLASVETQAVENEEIEMETLENFEGDGPKTYNGLSKTTLEQKLKNIYKEIDKSYASLQNIGIIIDADDKGKELQIDLCNQAVTKVFGEINITEDKKFKTVDFIINEEKISLGFDFFCMNVDNSGELTSVLRKIKKADSFYADCLVECWQPCYSAKNIPKEKSITANQFDKLWVEIFLKYDTTSKSNRNKNSANLGLVFEGKEEKGKTIFDFESPYLQELTSFLHTFR
jgi:hypothetical protein